MYYFKIILCIVILVVTFMLCGCSSPTRVETRTVCEAQLPLKAPEKAWPPNPKPHLPGSDPGF